MRQAVALNTLANQDWKTQLARGYSNIPNMAIVDVIEENCTNFYGTSCIVKWNVNTYYVSKRDLSFSELALEEAKKYEREELSEYKKYFKG